MCWRITFKKSLNFVVKLFLYLLFSFNVKFIFSRIFKWLVLLFLEINKTIIFLFVVKLIFCICCLCPEVSSGSVCLRCDNLPHPRDCDRAVQCNANEVRNRLGFCYTFILTETPFLFPENHENAILDRYLTIRIFIFFLTF